MKKQRSSAVFHLILFVKLWRIEFIIRPICHIVFNIGCHAVQFHVVADDMVVESGLPGEIDLFFVGETGNGLFESSYCC